MSKKGIITYIIGFVIIFLILAVSLSRDAFTPEVKVEKKNIDLTVASKRKVEVLEGVKKNGSYEERKINTGLYDNENIEITDRLREGDTAPFSNSN
jgi:hypothetical protein